MTILNREKCHPPPFKKTCPCTIHPLPFFTFSESNAFQIPMMTRRNNVAMKESNDNTNHKMVIARISFADDTKYFFLIACIKEDDVLTF